MKLFFLIFSFALISSPVFGCLAVSDPDDRFIPTTQVVPLPETTEPEETSATDEPSTTTYDI